MKIKPEAGAVKGSMPRTVPIHDHVIEQGFLDYVKSKGRGPLFYNPAPNGASGDTDITNPKRPRYVKTRERLAEWVRGLDIREGIVFAPRLRPDWLAICCFRSLVPCTSPPRAPSSKK
jgi:hypothetical protein